MSTSIHSPATLPSGLCLKNRLVKSAMSENMATSGSPGQSYRNLYGRFAEGGVGLCISGNVMVDSTALGEPHNVIFDEGITPCSAAKEWIASASTNGTAFWIQLNHPGKQSPKFLSSTPVAPSAIGYTGSMKHLFATPRALTEEEILLIVEKFAAAAALSHRCGAAGVQVHAAHGYLISQFLSPLHNQRADRWGGSIENRMRFLVEIFSAIRKRTAESFSVGVKLNSADFLRGGFSEGDAIEVAKKLDVLGCDLLEISGGTYESPKMMGGKTSQKASTQKTSTKQREAYFLDFCKKVRKEVQLPLLLTGGFRTREGMDHALAENACDFIGLARSLAINPDFANQLLANEQTESQVKPLSTGIGALDKLIPLEIVWYTHQLHCMGAGKSPAPSTSALWVALKSMWEFGVQSLRRTRKAHG